MKIIDLLLNKNMSPVERSTVTFDGCEWIHSEISEDVMLLPDVKKCVDRSFIENIIEFDNISIGISEGKILVSEVFINEVINVSYNSGNLFVGSDSYNISNFLEPLSFTFKDTKSNYFNTFGNYNILVEGLDGLTMVCDSGNIYLLLPNPADIYFSDHLNDGPVPQLPGDYLPFNHRLVLTRDGVNHRAFWAVDQCCPHVLEFVKGKLSADNKESFVDLLSINSDNQQLSLDINELSLSRWHGGTLGEQITDPDSVVDLSNVNEHTLSLALNRYLGIYGSDGILNNKVDLLNVGPKTITYNSATSEIEIRNDNGDIVSSVDISGINSQNLVWSNGMIQLDGVNGTGVSQAGFRKPVHFCSDTLGCVCGNRMTKAERESFGLTNPSGWTMPDWRTTRGFPQPTSRPDGREDFLDTNPTPCDMINFVVARIGGRANFNGYTYINIENETYIYNNYIANYNYSTNNYTTYNVWNTTNNTINNYYFGGGSTYIGDVYQNITQGVEIVTKTKYRGRIYSGGDRVVWSQNNGAEGTGVNARRFFPNFDGGEGWESVGGTLLQYNKMLYEPNFINPASNKLMFANGEEYQLTNPSHYTTSKSANNPSPSSSGACSEFGSKTITIPFDGNYMVSLNAEVSVDHNVQAFRVSVLKRSIENNKIYPLVDTKFGGDTTVGSRSLNNPAYPETKQYTCSGSKLVQLKKGDILFVGIRISSNTSWPKDIPAVWLNEQTPKFGNIYSNHTPGTASGLYVSWDPGTFSMDINYTYPGIPSGFDNTTNIFRPSPMAPDLTQRRYWSPVGGMSGSDAYGYSLAYPDMDNGYWNDDAVVTLLGPSGIYNPSGGGGGATDGQGGSMLTVVYQNKSYL